MDINTQVQEKDLQMNNLLEKVTEKLEKASKLIKKNIFILKIIFFWVILFF